MERVRGMAASLLPAAVFLVGALASISAGVQTRTIAVLDFEAKGLEQTAADMVSERVRTALAATGFFTVVERSRMQQILRGREFAQTGCSSTECAVEAGRVVGVTHIVAGLVAEAEDVVLLNVRLIDVKNGAAVLTVDDMDSYDLRSALSGGVSRVVERLLGAGVHGASSGDTTFVSNSRELITAIRSNAIVALRTGTYNISGQSRHPNTAVKWRDNYDGKFPVVTGLKNLTFTTRPGVQAEIVIDPAYGWVMELVSCRNVTFNNLRLGHTTPGNCLGGVLRFGGCEDVQVSGCDLYGSGTYGLGLDSVSRFAMRNSVIRECTYGIMEVSQSRHIEFQGCRMERNKEFTLVSVDACANVTYERCVFARNRGQALLGITRDNAAVQVSNCRFVDNQVGRFSCVKNAFSVVSCEFSGNTFTDHRAPRPEPARRDAAVDAYLRAKYPESFEQPDRVAGTDSGKRCMVYCNERNISWYRYHLEYVPNDSGYGAPFTPTSDGGCLIVGTHRPPDQGNRSARPCVIKLDSDMRLQWERFLAKPERGFKAYEGCSGVECGDGGYVVMSQAYVHPSMGGIGWFVKLDRDGKTIWERFLRGRGSHATPHPQWLRVDAQCAVTMEGHIYPAIADVRRERAFAWYGRISPTGTMIVDSTGGVLEGRERRRRLNRKAP